MYIAYDTSSHEKTGNITTIEQFEEGGLVENKHNEEEDESILASIDESSTDDYSRIYKDERSQLYSGWRTNTSRHLHNRRYIENT